MRWIKRLGCFLGIHKEWLLRSWFHNTVKFFICPRCGRVYVTHPRGWGLRHVPENYLRKINSPVVALIQKVRSKQ
jgi:hypothetical protein